MTPSSSSASTVTLKNGKVVEGRMAVAQFNLLQLYFNFHKEHFAALRSLAAEPRGEVLQKLKDDLRVAGLLNAQYELRPLVRDLLESAYRITPEGPVLATPFAGQCAADRKFLQQCADRQSQMQKQLLREITQSEPPRPDTASEAARRKSKRGRGPAV